jgi:hypothetical protein
MHLQIVAAQFAIAVFAVYRCTVHDVTVFSDRPCEPDAATYEADTSRVSTYTPPPPSPAAKPVPQPRAHRSRAPVAAGADQARHAADCERMGNALKDVAARMRAGYNAKQGEQLRERKARLEGQRRAKKCR